MRRYTVSTVRFGDRQKRPLVAFEVRITKSTVTAEVRPSNLHPDEVIRVVHHSHLVGLGITNAKAALGDSWHQAIFSPAVVFKTRDGRSRPSSPPMKCDAHRINLNDTPVSIPSRSSR